MVVMAPSSTTQITLPTHLQVHHPLSFHPSFILAFQTTLNINQKDLLSSWFRFRALAQTLPVIFYLAHSPVRVTDLTFVSSAHTTHLVSPYSFVACQDIPIRKIHFLLLKNGRLSLCYYHHDDASGCALSFHRYRYRHHE